MKKYSLVKKITFTPAPVDGLQSKCRREDLSVFSPLYDDFLSRLKDNITHSEELEIDEDSSVKEEDCFTSDQALDIFLKGAESSQSDFSDVMLAEITSRIGTFKLKKIFEYDVIPEAKDFNPKTKNYRCFRYIEVEKEGLKIVISKDFYSKYYKIAFFSFIDGKLTKREEKEIICPKIYALFPYYNHLVMRNSRGIYFLLGNDSKESSWNYPEYEYSYFHFEECIIEGGNPNQEISHCVLDQLGSAPSLICLLREMDSGGDIYSLVRLGEPRKIKKRTILRKLFSLTLSLDYEYEHRKNTKVVLDSQGKIWLQHGRQIQVYSPDFQLSNELIMRRGSFLREGVNGDVQICYRDELKM